MNLCSVDGCLRPSYAKSLCQYHYKAKRRETHGREEKARTEPCVICGVVVTRTPSKNRMTTCSSKCRRDLQFGVSEPLPPDHWALWYGKSSPWSPPKAGPSSARFIDRACDECGLHFLTDRTVGGWRDSDRLCSRSCRRRVAKRRRRGREHGLDESFRWVDVIGIWIAMGRRCAYCETEMDEQPEPDHVLPLSRGGRNDLGNILPACARCNRDKRALTLEEWTADRALRGKPSIRTDWQTYDPRAPHLVLDRQHLAS